ncbi:MAG: hypothetical protein NTY81_03790 [Candidatus Staskawiczbacteria bacterium]|nr:hypothetical protein [Candidatus Staskawiczbacteria bacterium]
MVIILSVVLSVSALLYSEIKIARNIGNSTIAFYVADSGAEKVLYYDRQVIPDGASRGVCNICAALNYCASDIFTTGCDTCSATPNSADGCANCTDCRIVFKTNMNSDPQKYYNEVVNISLLSGEFCKLSGGYLQSYGTYADANRAVNLNITREVRADLGPSITNAVSVVSNNGKITISATVSPYGNDVTVTAYVQYQDGTLVDTVQLTAQGQGHYKKVWQEGTIGVTYYVSIAAVNNNNGYCTSIAAIPE